MDVVFRARGRRLLFSMCVERRVRWCVRWRT